MAQAAHFTLPPVSEIFRDPFDTTHNNVPETGSEVSETESEEIKCEISFCDARINAKGDKVYLHTGTKRAFDVSNDPLGKQSALVQTK